MKAWVVVVFAFLMLASAAFAISFTTRVIFVTPTPNGITVHVQNPGAEQAFGLEPGTLERTVFIHYKEAFSHNRGGNAKNPCSKLLGTKWKSTPINYVIHPDLEAKDPLAIFTSSETWDSATSKELFSDAVTFNSTANWDVAAPDGRNELSLGNHTDTGAIAVTVVWSGIPIGGKGLQIIEYDILFDTDFQWGDVGSTDETAPANTTLMDLQNIATHEIGHGAGEADIYDSSCTDVTMYGFAEEGETKKRTLAAADISGLQKMYGA